MHIATIGLIGWLALTAIINTLSSLYTPEQVDARAEALGFFGKIGKLLRKGGVEPVELVRALFAFFKGNPPEPKFANHRGNGPTLMAFVFVCVAFATTQSGCAWFQKKEPVIIHTFADLSACIDAELTSDPSLSAEGIIIACGERAIPDLINLVESRRAPVAAAKRCH